MSSTVSKMGRQQSRKNEPSASPQNYIPEIFLRVFFVGHEAAMDNEDTLASGAEGSSWDGGRTVSCRRKLLDSGAANVAVFSTDSVWRTISGAFLPQKFPKQLAAKRKFEAVLPSEENVSCRRVRFRGKLKEIASLENHLLLCILNQLRIKCSSLLEDDTRASGCSCCDTAEMTATRDIVSKTHDSSFGVFVQPQPIESLNLARRLAAGKPKGTACKQSALGFARLQGEPQMRGSNSLHPDMGAESFKFEAIQSHTSHELKRVPFGPFQGESLTGFMNLLQQFQVIQPQQGHPDKRRLNSVQDFFHYTETEGRELFQELDRDKDGQVTLDDLNVAMDKMKLSPFYAKKFLQRTQTHWLAKSCGWSEFSSVIQEKEPTILRLFNSLDLSESGTLQRTHVKDLLRNAGLPATDTNASAMMNCLGVDTEGSIMYGHFRKFMLLVPTEQLAVDPWRIWFKAATFGPETSNEDMLGSVLSRVALFSREFLDHSETRKVIF